MVAKPTLSGRTTILQIVQVMNVCVSSPRKETRSAETFAEGWGNTVSTRTNTYVRTYIHTHTHTLTCLYVR